VEAYEGQPSEALAFFGHAVKCNFLICVESELVLGKDTSTFRLGSIIH